MHLHTHTCIHACTHTHAYMLAHTHTHTHTSFHSLISIVSMILTLPDTSEQSFWVQRVREHTISQSATGTHQTLEVGTLAHGNLACRKTQQTVPRQTGTPHTAHGKLGKLPLGKLSKVPLCKLALIKLLRGTLAHKLYNLH